VLLTKKSYAILGVTLRGLRVLRAFVLKFWRRAGAIRHRA
jgi:hypothetical protein